MVGLDCRILHADEASSSARELRRAYIAPETLRTNKLVAGEWYQLTSPSNPEGLILQLWPRATLQPDSIYIDIGHESNIEEGSISVTKWTDSCHLAKSVVLKRVDEGNASEDVRSESWIKAILKEHLMSMKFIRTGVSVQPPSLSSYRINKIVKSDKRRNDSLEQRMKGIKLVNGDIEKESPFCEMDWRTEVSFTDSTKEKDVHNERASRTDRTSSSTGPSATPSYINIYQPTSITAYTSLGGLSAQITQIRSLLELPLSQPHLFTLFGLTPPRGILLHGPPGTGKTALSRAVAGESGCSCIVVNGPELSSAYHGESEERLRSVFTEARKRKPCIVVLDEIDALCPRRDGDGSEVERRVVATLLTLMDGMNDGEGVFVIAATNRPNSVDPALRRPGRFDREIEIGIPDVKGRREILQILLEKMPHILTSNDILSLASRTHGFVGADLSSLIRESAVSAIQRHQGSDGPQLTVNDVEGILPSIRPSTMRDIFIEMPQVKWTDIGGQDDVKQKLRECVEWPLKHAESFKRLGVDPPKGVLLYGPPGCSKTLTARALATESGLNFIAVKGPELLNKFVGESERAVREIFRKARAASPSIIFFDEIDALGSSRSDDISHNGVLTSLLNEMDGIEELTGVTIIAATNRPDVLDSALMRPGRLDRILFVGAPDFATRKDIFRIRFSAMSVEPGINVDELATISDGCSGAEVAAICQDAALAAMNEDIDAPFVSKRHLVHSAKTVRRRITPAMLRFFEEWRDQSGIRSA